MESSQWKIWNHLFCCKVSFLSKRSSLSISRYSEGQGLNQSYLYLYYPLFQAEGIYAINKMTNLFRFSSESPHYEIFLVWIKESGEKGSTVDTNMSADCMLENTSTKHNKRLQLKHRTFDDISFRELFCKMKVYSIVESKWFLLKNEICHFRIQSMYVLIPQIGNNMFVIFHNHWSCLSQQRLHVYVCQLVRRYDMIVTKLSWHFDISNNNLYPVLENSFGEINV